MNSFLQRHAACVIGTLSGWDRLRFRGTLRMLANVVGLEHFLSYTGQLFKDFGKYVFEQSRQVRAASLAVAEEAGRPVEHLMAPSVSKEDRGPGHRPSGWDRKGIDRRADGGGAM